MDPFVLTRSGPPRRIRFENESAVGFEIAGEGREFRDGKECAERRKGTAQKGSFFLGLHRLRSGSARAQGRCHSSSGGVRERVRRSASRFMCWRMSRASSTEGSSREPAGGEGSRRSGCTARSER